MRGVTALRSLQVAGRPGGLALDHLDQLPALLTPLIQDLLQRVRDQRHGCVLPFLHSSVTPLIDRHSPVHLPLRQGGVNLLQMPQTLVLPSRGLVIADRLRFATSATERVRGLLGTDALAPGAALVIPTRQVHTFGMRYSIDVIFCDEGWTVVRVVRDMRPNRMSRLVLRARRVVELPAGGARSVEVGDRLSLEGARRG